MSRELANSSAHLPGHDTLTPRTHTQSQHSQNRSELLTVAFQEERLPREKLLLAVVDEATGRVAHKAAVPIAPMVPGLLYSLRLQLPAAGGGGSDSGDSSCGAGGGGGGPALYVTLCLRPAARTQLQRLRRAPALRDGGGSGGSGGGTWQRQRVLQARLAATGAAPPAAANDGASELWAIWRPAGAGAGGALTPVQASQLHATVDATDEHAVGGALRRATAAALGEPPAAAPAGGAGRAAPWGADAPILNERPETPPRAALVMQALPVRRLGSDNSASSSGDGGAPGAAAGMLWPPDHMALLLPAAGAGSVAADGSPGDEPCAVLELLAVRYGGGGGSGSGGGEEVGRPAGDGRGRRDADDGPQPGAAGRAVAALLRARKEKQQQQQQQRGAAAPRPQSSGQAAAGGVRGGAVASLVLSSEMLPLNEPGRALMLNGLALRRPDGALAAGPTAAVEVVPWDAESFLAHLQSLAGAPLGRSSSSGGGGGSGRRQLGQVPEAAATAAAAAGTTATDTAAVQAAGLLAACLARGGQGGAASASLLVDTLRRDMVSKQAALERLQRQLDAARAKGEAAAARVRDLQGRNR